MQLVNRGQHGDQHVELDHRLGVALQLVQEVGAREAVAG
jgi:hypothetical protein